MIRTSSIRYTYPSAVEMNFPDLTVPSGGHFLLLGESGSGKTTLLHLLGGLLKVQQGKVEVNGTELSTLSESRLDHFRGKHYGFIFQRNHLLAALTVEQNLLMAPYLAGLKQDAQRVAEVLQELGIADQRKKRIHELSLGQAQRVAIARAVLNKPAVILADEPTSALDDKNCERVTDLLLNVAQQHQSILIIATHDHRLKQKVNTVIHLS